MARKRDRTPRPKLTLLPAPVSSLAMLIGGAALCCMTWLARGDGWPAFVWAVFGIFIMSQPVSGIVRGEGDQLRVGIRKIDLTGIVKVAVYNRKQWGFSYSVAVLKFGGRVDEISGAFLTSKAFTKMIDWIGVSPEVLEGFWSSRALAAQRPDLTQQRPKR
ncbi:hypothetical protein [Brooklawnia sp.]|uniref:hypothetical protein n=1 Tax=Brooklawnia sp. TaxID=2699740 RepID=UPI00311EEB01